MHGKHGMEIHCGLREAPIFLNRSTVYFSNKKSRTPLRIHCECTVCTVWKSTAAGVHGMHGKARVSSRGAKPGVWTVRPHQAAAARGIYLRGIYIRSMRKKTVSHVGAVYSKNKHTWLLLVITQYVRSHIAYFVNKIIIYNYI